MSTNTTHAAGSENFLWYSTESEAMRRRRPSRSMRHITASECASGRSGAKVSTGSSRPSSRATVAAIRRGHGRTSGASGAMASGASPSWSSRWRWIANDCR